MYKKDYFIKGRNGHLYLSAAKSKNCRKRKNKRRPRDKFIFHYYDLSEKCV